MKFADKEQLGIVAKKTKKDILQKIVPLEQMVDKINIAQKTINNEPDHCFLKFNDLYTPVLNETVPFVKVDGNMEALNGVITLKPKKTYEFIWSVSYADNTASNKAANISYVLEVNGIAVASFNPHRGNYNYEFSSVFVFQYTNESTEEVQCRFYTSSISQNDKINGLSGLSVKEIGNGRVVDPVEYVNTSNGIEDTPIGHIITVLGEIAPKHYIPFDNNDLDIAEYPYLAQYIKDTFGSYNFFGGDGINTFKVYDNEIQPEINDVTPIMVSNISPTPYKITASSFYGSVQEPWRAFDTNSQTYWLTSNGNTTGWIKLDFGSKQSMNMFVIRSMGPQTSSVDVMPKDYELYGSNDDITYNKLYEVKDKIWIHNEEKVHTLENIVNYRYYRLDITNNNGAPSNVILPELRFILSRKMENKYIKYEPTYFMNIQGLMEETLLWEGDIGSNNSTTVTNNITLNDSIQNYDTIGFYYYAIMDILNYPSYQEIPSNIIKDAIDSDLTNNRISFIHGYMNYSNFTNVNPISSTYQKLTINQQSSHLTKIVGIKYKTFQNNNVN